DYKHKIEFQEAEYDYINKYCKEKPIDWTASVWDLDSLQFLMKYKLPFLKLPSAVITNKELVEETAKSGIPICISSGMSSLKEVDEAVNSVMKYTSNFVLMHTNSSYPTPPQELNLSLIPFYKERYECTVGYSGHEQKLEPTVSAATLGAQVIERHITLSHDLWGTDQRSSVEVVGMDILYKRIKDLQLIIGTPKKEVTESEKPIRNKLRGETK
ncbi:MAG TPA: N-acetylneuraminate synthase, partial [Flavobacteriaceae bacterium]|nr:N-acetylneuraminate synthase [Flavobacteriaceae bacterium]